MAERRPGPPKRLRAVSGREAGGVEGGAEEPAARGPGSGPEGRGVEAPEAGLEVPALADAAAEAGAEAGAEGAAARGSPPGGALEAAPVLPAGGRPGGPAATPAWRTDAGGSMGRAPRARGSRGVVDLCVGQREDGEAFLCWLRDACELRGLSCEVAHTGVVEDLRRELCAGRLRVRVLLDLTAAWGQEDDPYVRLCYAVKDCGGRVIDDPDAAALADHKAATHHRLERAGLPVPPTVVLRRWMADRSLTAEERQVLGDAVVIKPARGWGWRGVVLGAPPEREAIARARDHDRSDDYLVQRQITYPWLEDDEGRERPAWWRVFYLFGEIVPCWWSPETSEYRHLSLREMSSHQLLPLARLSAEVARLTGMDFFSTEICLADEPAVPGTPYQAGGRPFFLIDYVNDQCDLRVQSRHKAAPPDAVVRHFAERFAELVWRDRHGLPLDHDRTLWLRRAADGDPSL